MILARKIAKTKQNKIMTNAFDHNGWRRSNRRKKPRHRNFFLEIDLHFIEGVTVEFIK